MKPEPIELYASIQALVQNEARKIANDVYEQKGTQYGVPETPYHEHNQIDSPYIPIQNISGYIPVVSAVPTVIPTGNFYQQFRIVDDGMTVSLYGFDTTTRNWVNLSGGSGGTPGGSNSDVQFNDSGTFGGDPTFTFDSFTKSTRLDGDFVFGDSDDRTISVETVTSGDGKALEISSGATTDVTGRAGSLLLEAGSSSSQDIGGLAQLSASFGVTTGGQTIITGGDATNGQGGDVRVFGGNSDNGAPGSIKLFGGSGTGSNNFGDIMINNGYGIATTSTNGFLVLPVVSGTPTGVPTAGNGAMIYDTSANKLWIYNGSWKSATFT